jgi:hypothetical protein
MRLGKLEVRPLGGATGCLMMIILSIILSVVCTVCVNLVYR